MKKISVLSLFALVILLSTSPVVFAKKAKKIPAKQSKALVYNLTCSPTLSVLDVSKAYLSLGTKNYSGLGEFVESINGISKTNKKFWSLYINDKKSTLGASNHICNNNEKITWKFEEIK